jgi:DNA-binding MarR family transcriptional regulator
MADYRRTQGGPLLGHDELVQALGRDKSNVSHSLRTLEARGLIVISRTPGGQANTVTLTSEGRNWASEFE